MPPSIEGNKRMSDNQAHSRILRTLVTTIFFISFPFGLLQFTLPVLGKELGASALAIAGLYSAFSLTTVLLRPVVGWALDRYGRRPFLVGGLAGYLVANLGFLAAQSIGMLYLARVAQSIGSGLTWLAAYAIIADVALPERRGRSFGRVDQAHAQAMLAGMFVFFTVYGFMTEGEMAGGVQPAWKATFGLFAIFGAYAVWRAWRLPETGRPQATTAFWPSLRSNWQRISRVLLTLMGIVFLTSAAQTAVSPLIIIFLQDRFQASLVSIGWAFLPMALIWSFLPSRMGAIGDRLGRKLPMAAGLAVSGTVTLFIPRVPSLLLLAALWAVEALAFSASVPAEEALVADLSGSGRRGESFGLYTFAAGLGAVVGPLVGGWLYDNLGHAAPFYATAAAVFLGAALILILVKEPPRVSPGG